MTTGATIFSGGEGVGVGMRQVGITHLWGVEYDDEIAQVARDNGFHSITADVREVNIGKLERPDILHASPVCKNASVAKSGAREAPEDVETAHATARFIEKLRPGIFTLENVWGYRNFVAFRMILDCLRREGYAVDYWHLNAANYGVPQTRKRLVLVAKLDGTPRRPEPTHAKNPGSMFGLKKWVGWYEAIEDLIPTLPESQFAQWQLDRLPNELCDNALVGDGDMWRPIAMGAEASPTISASNGACAFIIPPVNADGTAHERFAKEPSHTVQATAYKQIPKAFIVPGGNANSFSVRGQDEPARTVGDIERIGNISRAFIVNESSTMEVRDSDEPIAVQVSSDRGLAQRAWLSQGHVVAMTPRCLARFQSFPDDYILPASNKLACQVIGNAVPPLLYQRVIEANL